MENKSSLLASLIILVFFLMGLFRGIFASEGTAKQALEVQGYRDVTVTDHDWFLVGFRGGDSSDAAKFTALATNPAGERVKVYIFTGWPFKSGTIRGGEKIKVGNE